MNEALEEILDEFEEIEDRMEKFEFLHDLSNELNQLPLKNGLIPQNHGCQSEAHVEVWIDSGLVQFREGQMLRLLLD